MLIIYMNSSIYPAVLLYDPRLKKKVNKIYNTTGIIRLTLSKLRQMPKLKIKAWWKTKSKHNATAECNATWEDTAKLGPKASADATTKDKSNVQTKAAADATDKDESKATAKSAVKAWCNSKSKAPGRAR